jgi:hypothetical protein
MPVPALKQTTIRVDPDVLRKARYYLDAENRSVNEFLAEQLAAYIWEHEGCLRLPRRPEPAPVAVAP